MFPFSKSAYIFLPITQEYPKLVGNGLAPTALKTYEMFLQPRRGVVSPPALKIYEMFLQLVGRGLAPAVYQIYEMFL